MNNGKRFSIYGSSRKLDERKKAVIEKHGEKELNEIISNAITVMFVTIHEQIVKTDTDESTMMIDTDGIVDTLLDYIFYNDEELQDKVSQRIQDEKRQFYNSLQDRRQNNTKKRKELK